MKVHYSFYRSVKCRVVLVMRIGVIGATGFIGKEFCKQALLKGHDVVGYSRKARVDDEIQWREFSDVPDLSELDAIVNYAGESVAQRWSEKKKVAFATSRVGVTNTIVAEIEKMSPEQRPKVLFNSSAVGYYGDCASEKLYEKSSKGEGYLADLCEDWESSALKAQKLGVRVVIGRIGLVMGKGGEAWEKMYNTFRMGLGGPLGTGRQWMPWVDVKDVAGGTLYTLETEISGAVNLVSPVPMENSEFTKVFAESLGRPAILRVPEFALRLLFGDFGTHILDSYRAYPKVLNESGYSFTSVSLEDFLKS